MKVKAKNFPVRYKGKTYSSEEVFEMDKKHFNENIVELIEDDHDVVRLTKNEIMAKLDELGIEYDPKATKDVLIEVLKDNLPETGE